jgi:hypothetical protein
MYPITNLLTTKEERIEAEKLRREVLHIQNLDEYQYLNELKYKQIHAYGTKINKELVAGCYLSVNYNLLNIQQLFVKEKYQNTGLKLGRKLVIYILNHKEEIEKLTGKKISASIIMPSSNKSFELYKKIGYEPFSEDISMMYKSL